jgi:hypothetical protein
VIREEQEQVLRMVYDGVISAAEADRLLQALDSSAGGQPYDRASLPALRVSRSGLHPKQYPLIGGSLLTAVGASLLATAYATGRAPGLLVGGYVVLGLGLLLALAGLWLVRAAWLRIQVHGGRDGSGVHLCFPVPLTLVAWLVRVTRPLVHRSNLTGVDGLILALRDEARGGRAMTIEVNEENGERVEVSLG